MVIPRNIKVEPNGVSFIVTCFVCEQDITVTLTPDEYYNYFVAELHAQDAMPNQSADIRELCISGTCGKCFDEMFKEEEDE